MSGSTDYGVNDRLEAPFLLSIKQQIAFCIYRKNVKEDWGEEEFADYQVITPSGGTESVQLAERQTVICEFHGIMSFLPDTT